MPRQVTALAVVRDAGGGRGAGGGAVVAGTSEGELLGLACRPGPLGRLAILEAA